MTRLCRIAGAMLGIAVVGCAEPQQLAIPPAAGKTGSGATGNASSVGSGGRAATTGSGGSTARGGTSSSATNPNLGGATARGGATATTTLGSGGLTVATPTCTDRLKNGEETDIDCGGTCETKCAFGKACAVDADCAVAICAAGLCTTCKNTTKDGDETDVDCGGSCPRCAEGQACATIKDCATYNCDTTTLLCGPMTNCLAAVTSPCTCAEKVRNAGDTAGCQKIIDCYLTNSCKPGEACATGNDAVCGTNTLGVDGGKIEGATAVYACACPS